MPTQQKNICLLHFKTGERDGVSLEIEKRAKILTELGAKVSYITGFDGLKRDRAYCIPELDAEAGYNRFLRDQCFGERDFDESTMLAFYYPLEWKIYTKLREAFKQLCPDLVFVHNMFSHGCNLAASTALLKVLDRFETPTVAVHHDFWYERDRLREPRYDFIQEILGGLPAKREYIRKHQVINSFAAEETLRRRGIRAETIGDYFDFQQPVPQVDAYNADLRDRLGIRGNDLVIVHATRITGHKVIENAFMFAHELEQRIRAAAPFTLAGKALTPDSRVVVLLPNYVEPEAKEYFRLLKNYQQRLNVHALWASDHFLPERRQVDGKKIYSFWDSYLFADLVTYTSVQEGFGNQLLEAVYFRKLPVILEYPVFEKDLRDEGYGYVSLGSSRELTTRDGLRLTSPDAVHAAVEQTIDLLQNARGHEQLVTTNVEIAHVHHDVENLRQDLRGLVAEVV